MIDLGINDNICEMFVFEPKASYVIASNSGKGFVVDENHLLAQTRNGRKIMNLAEGETAMFCRKVTGNMVAVVGDNRKLLIFKTEEIPTMARGRGVTLQKYKDGGLSDMQIFGKLGGTLTFFARRYLWDNSERFLTDRELRVHAIKEKHKEDKV